MRPRPSNLAGFTLIELILVLLVLAIAVAIVAPSLRGFGIGRRSNEVATQIVSLAQWSRTQAVTEARTYRLNFDISARTFWVTSQQAGVFQPVSSEYGDALSFPDGMTMRIDLIEHADGTYIEFRADGRSDPARIFLTDKLDNVTEIACASPTELLHVLSKGEVDH